MNSNDPYRNRKHISAQFTLTHCLGMGSFSCFLEVSEKDHELKEFVLGTLKVYN